MTESNPVRAGFVYRNEAILKAVANFDGLKYEPDAKGMFSARKAVSRYYKNHGQETHPDSIILTASTSEAYSFVFKLLAEPGDEVLMPRPSYPLLEPLLRLESLRIIQYPLNYHPETGWRINADQLSKTISTRTRAIVAVNPNNPTGSFINNTELALLNQLCRRHNLALIVDEVFLDYQTAEYGNNMTAAANTKALTFVLSGFSKVLGLPQLKLAWIVVSGPSRKRREACDGLEYIADAYLSVGTPVQKGARDFFRGRQAIQKQIQERIQSNSEFCQKRLTGIAEAEVLKREGGWYAVLKLSSGLNDERTAIKLLQGRHVLVYPGYFFDFADDNVLVVSLITPPEKFQRGVSGIISELIGR
ncbi:pyridoxal phosphate-dependent aminotransferase [Fibrobacterota bacterium]